VIEPEYPRYSYRQLQQAAEDFLTRHHPGGTLPIPIEEIVEFGVGLDIVPFPNLRGAFDVSQEVASRRLRKWNETSR